MSWHHIEFFKRKVLASSLSESTIATYSTGIRQYLRFCHRFSVTPLPLSEGVLENFCISLFRSVGYKSLKVYLCGVQLWSRMNSFVDVIVSMERLQYVLRGIRRLQGNSHTRPPRAPITLPMLRFMFTSAGLFPAIQDRCMIRSAITLAFFGLLRVS